MKTLAGAAIALWMGMAATTAQAAVEAQPCLTETEAQSLITAVLPDVFQQVGRTCSSALPENATLRGGLPPLVARYQAPADLAWPQAMAAFGKIGGKDMAGVDPRLLRPMMGPMIAGAIAQDIKPRDCATIDRAISLMSPLPPSNTAGLIVLLASVAGGKDKKDSPFEICPTPTATASATARP
jgi:hypothetical protein